MSKKSIINGIIYEEVTEGNYFIYPIDGSFKDDFDKPYQIRVVNEADGSWSTGLQYEDEYVPYKLPDFVTAVNSLFPHEFKILGYEAIEKTVKPGSNTSGRVWVPLDWLGKRVMIVRLE